MSGLWCVIPAAGRGRRFGGDVPKQYLRLADKPLLLHTLERLAAHPRIAGLMLVVAADDASWVQGLVEVLGKPLLRATGGAERADSVLAGLRALPASVAADDAVLVHDAARPCVRAADISRLIDLAVPAGGGLLAAPLRDTLKRADAQGRVAATEPREARWRALTPQLFPRAALEAALVAAAAAGAAVTDEAMAMERAGHAPLLVEGSEDNIKVTTPADLAFAEFILQRA
ncbi:MAG: 2-C-methyl-D-erythritol 4-phosphate cytidylyltransferase [Lysobacterales bacterium 69-70]|nr:2-C-methyl-D-erythritol 4-phosphate cytidylyltransferase [Xanthomonadaceae bacterium]ODU31977.1 MAG: 2-C-methyl-D-erythritol 4-phosphate cytidylyltransferase [Xanthomonadaceae bacterium SCN 69-320]ODV20033.1 MAG: 2-C-methyl-D-erythritol 4-phosphate cytidylyltransferase [Xanthomonadaceae bacterium SCN 69-25]OJZ01701.1 MAG: 2-C-methyl-D-erythritol 4-phosphate cytidylyltransferase [Xanthomonadales bacterium 69-70]